MNFRIQFLKAVSFLDQQSKQESIKHKSILIKNIFRFSVYFLSKHFSQIVKKNLSWNETVTSKIKSMILK